MQWFGICDASKWSHLPVAGGWYDQHPTLVEGFRYIFAQRAKQEERDAKDRERKMKSKRR